MKKITPRQILLAGALSLLSLSLTHCASDTSSYGKIGPDYYSSPMTQQIQMQEQMSRVTRSLIRF